MDINKIIDLLAKSNINPNDIYDLITKAQTMDLSKEECQRELIKEGCELSGKTISQEKENEIINLIKEKGISNDLFSIFRQ